MKEIRIGSWDEYRRTVSDIRASQGEADLVFRGQSSGDWPLETTLEREAGDMPFEEYFRKARLSANEIESISGLRWPLDEFDRAENKEGDGLFSLFLPAYGYLIYLRHHGFPSPLLDWSESPFVAAFFAYEEACDQGDPVVYCYAQSSPPRRARDTGVPTIDLRGPYVTTDRRHFSQQAWYTVAYRWDAQARKRVFTSHRSVFEAAGGEKELVWKIVLPATLRKEVLRELADYNINAYSLFHSEDALVRSLGMRHFLLGEA